LKVLYITPGCFDKGGISRYSRYQITAIRELFGQENTYVMSLLGPDNQKIEENFDVEFYGLPNNSRWQQFKFTIHFFWKVLTLRPKTIVAAHVNLSGIAVIASKLIGAKTVLNVYGLELWSNMRFDASWGLRKVNSIISDCHNTKNYLVQKNIRDTSDITVIWDCVNLNKFKRTVTNQTELKKKYGINNGSRFTILSLGRLSYAAKHKGYHRLIEVFEQLNQSNFYLVIAGKGDMLDELKHIVLSKGLEQSVCFTGMVHETDMAGLYSLPDVFSLVSEVGEGMGEGIPLTPLEAMACGSPIIVGNQDGSREAVFKSQNGFVIEPYDLDTHRVCIESMYNNEALHNNMRKAAAEVAHVEFSYERFLEEHKTFFRVIES
jgi:phosphatidylinositol alpha-1,6-mannosyltransferase